MEYTGYWTFFCNPKKWEIDKFLSGNIEYDTYQVTSYQADYFDKGQLGIIRVSIDHRTKKQLNGRPKLLSGIYAIVEILSTPKSRKKGHDAYWANWTDKENDKQIVEIRYLANLLNNPILLQNLKNNPIIDSDKYLIKGFQASSMPLQAKVFKEILRLTENKELVLENTQIESVSSLADIRRIENKYLNAVPEVKEIISKRVERGIISTLVKKLNNYECQICKSLNLPTHTFKKSNGVYYIETHHIIPVSELRNGTLGFSNLITVCANHHRQLHYGNIEIISIDDSSFKFELDGQVVVINKTKIEE